MSEKSGAFKRDTTYLDGRITADGRDADARRKIRIFSVGFLGASPARIARQIDDRREALLDSAGTNFQCRGGKNALDQIRIPG